MEEGRKEEGRDERIELEREGGRERGEEEGEWWSGGRQIISLLFSNLSKQHSYNNYGSCLSSAPYIYTPLHTTHLNSELPEVLPGSSVQHQPITSLPLRDRAQFLHLGAQTHSTTIGKHLIGGGHVTGAHFRFQLVKVVILAENLSPVSRNFLLQRSVWLQQLLNQRMNL